LKKLIIGVLLLALGACATETGNNAKTIGGKNLGERHQETISIDHSKVQFPPHIAKRIVKVEKIDLAGRYQEWISFKGGAKVLFEKKHRGAFVFPIPEPFFKQIFAKGKIRDKKILNEEIDMVTTNSVAYSQIDRGKTQCFAFIKKLGRDVIYTDFTGSDAYIRGILCKETDFETLKTQLLSDVNGIKTRS